MTTTPNTPKRKASKRQSKEAEAATQNEASSQMPADKTESDVPKRKARKKPPAKNSRTSEPINSDERKGITISEVLAALEVDKKTNPERYERTLAEMVKDVAAVGEALSRNAAVDSAVAVIGSTLPRIDFAGLGVRSIVQNFKPDYSAWMQNLAEIVELPTVHFPPIVFPSRPARAIQLPPCDIVVNTGCNCGCNCC